MSKFIYFILIIGFLVSAYLAYNHYFSKSYVCIVNGGCDKVLTSKYSQVFNTPISLFGSIYFLILLIFLSLSKNFRFLEKIVKIFVFIGFFVGLTLIYIQIFVLKAICIYCMIVDTILLISPILFAFNKIKLR